LIYWNKSQEANEGAYVRANREKLKTHLFIFGMFLIGGIIGALSFNKVGYISVIPLSLLLVLIAGFQIYRDISAKMKDWAS
jgi:hypothetical protein